MAWPHRITVPASSIVGSCTKSATLVCYGPPGGFLLATVARVQKRLRVHPFRTDGPLHAHGWRALVAGAAAVEAALHSCEYLAARDFQFLRIEKSTINAFGKQDERIVLVAA